MKTKQAASQRSLNRQAALPLVPKAQLSQMTQQQLRELYEIYEIILNRRKVLMYDN